MIRFYQNLRRDVSLLLSEGHLAAMHYPVAVVWSEARIIRQRYNQKTQIEAVTMQTVIASLFSGKPELLDDLLQRMEDVG